MDVSALIALNAIQDYTAVIIVITVVTDCWAVLSPLALESESPASFLMSSKNWRAPYSLPDLSFPFRKWG